MPQDPLISVRNIWGLKLVSVNGKCGLETDRSESLASMALRLMYKGWTNSSKDSKYARTMVYVLGPDNSGNPRKRASSN